MAETMTREARLAMLRARNAQVGSPAAKWLLGEVDRLETILCSYLADHEWHRQQKGLPDPCGCPACLSARDALEKPAARAQAPTTDGGG